MRLQDDQHSCCRKHYTPSDVELAGHVQGGTWLAIMDNKYFRVTAVRRGLQSDLEERKEAFKMLHSMRRIRLLTFAKRCRLKQSIELTAKKLISHCFSLSSQPFHAAPYLSEFLGHLHSPLPASLQVD